MSKVLSFSRLGEYENSSIYKGSIYVASKPPQNQMPTCEKKRLDECRRLALLILTQDDLAASDCSTNLFATCADHK